MWKRRRLWFLFLGVAGLTFGVLYESATHVGRGWLRGEAFFDGRPTSYWAAELAQWEIVEIGGGGGRHWPVYGRRSPWPKWLERYMPIQKAEWPALLDGDADASSVLHALCNHPSRHVQFLASSGLDRIHNGERGPSFPWSLPDE
jgi:hypothetical protein